MLSLPVVFILLPAGGLVSLFDKPNNPRVLPDKSFVKRRQLFIKKNALFYGEAMKKSIVASLFLLVAVASGIADEFSGFITRFGDGKMTVKKSKGGEAPDEITLKVPDTVRIVRGKFNMGTMKIEASGDFEGGKDALVRQVQETNEKIKRYIDEGKKGFGPGVFASFVTEGDKVVEVRVVGGGKKKQER